MVECFLVLRLTRKVLLRPPETTVRSIYFMQTLDAGRFHRSHNSRWRNFRSAEIA